MIADELGLTKAAVYYYFQAKSDILDEAMRPGVQRLGVLLDETTAMRGRRARTEHLVSGFVDFLVQNRYVVTASTEPAVSRHAPDAVVLEMRQRAMTLMFGDHPTPAERLSPDVAFLLPKVLPSLADLTDEELREVLKTTMLRILGCHPDRAGHLRPPDNNYDIVTAPATDLAGLSPPSRRGRPVPGWTRPAEAPFPSGMPRYAAAVL